MDQALLRHAWKDRSRLLGSSDSLSLSKALLERLDDAANRPPLWTYRKYLSSTTSYEVSHHSLSLLSLAELEKFYGVDQPLVAPKYLDIFQEGDLSKLEQVVGRRLVLLSPREGAGVG
jgi:hypothetical protein